MQVISDARAGLPILQRNYNATKMRRLPTIPNPRYVNPIVVTAIESFDHGYKKRVILTDTRDGMEHEILFGDSVSDRLIRIKAPFLVNKTKQKRRLKNV